MPIESHSIRDPQHYRYYSNQRGKWLHAVREITHHYRNGVFSHTGIKYKCNNLGFLGPHHPGAKLYQEIPLGIPLCPRCFPTAQEIVRPIDVIDAEANTDALFFKYFS